ncbi:MAG: hypothetical protein AB7D36_12130, partial [Oscillospiraceae bacterium]
MKYYLKKIWVIMAVLIVMTCLGTHALADGTPTVASYSFVTEKEWETDGGTEGLIGLEDSIVAEVAFSDLAGVSAEDITFYVNLKESDEDGADPISLSYVSNDGDTYTYEMDLESLYSSESDHVELMIESMEIDGASTAISIKPDRTTIVNLSDLILESITFEPTEAIENLSDLIPESISFEATEIKDIYSWNDEFTITIKFSDAVYLTENSSCLYVQLINSDGNIAFSEPIYLEDVDGLETDTISFKFYMPEDCEGTFAFRVRFTYAYLVNAWGHEIPSANNEITSEDTFDAEIALTFTNVF